MGDLGETSQFWMPPTAPQALPLGKGNIYPFGEPHAVSVSLPTWNSVIGLSRKEKWVYDSLEWSYPRFYINKPIRELSMAVLQRLRVTNTSCMVFASAVAARKCITALSTAPAYSEAPSPLQHVRFYMPPESNLGDKPTHWANFSAIIIPSDLWKEAMAFWRDTGTGLSSRHAEFCLEEFQYLDSDSLTPEFCTSAPQKRNHRQVPHYVARIQSAASRVDELKAFLANLATSEQPGEPEVNPDDVFLYPNGMNAIYSLSESLSTLKTGSTVVAYGWLYPESVDVLRGGSWNFLSYKLGTEEELDHLENALQSGLEIEALFCELPSNILLTSINLHRVRTLADKYGFIVACDDTVAGFVNIDAMRYVDVMISSLTKTFSGFSNVTGGSLVINSSSPRYQSIHEALSKNYENGCFPLDSEVLHNNCQNMAWRVKKCNDNTLPLVTLLSSHPSIAQVHHPSTAPNSPHYRSVMRKDGGYGNVLSIVFHSPRSAEYFYDVLGVCKGSSFGTNFTLAIPYVQLANYWNLEKVPKYGVPQHIIRMSVGLEDSDQLVATVTKALKAVEKFESKHCLEC